MMKVVVISTMLSKENKETIEQTASEAGAELLFFSTEQEAMPTAADADVIYGPALNIAATSKNLKWLCVPSAGVDFLREDSFANKDCLLTNSAGSYGVSISEHMIAVSIMMMRRIPEFQAGVMNREWLSPRAQKSLKDSRVTVLGTGDIGTHFAKRLRAFEPAAIIGVNRSGRSEENCYDKIVPVTELDAVLKETDLLAMSLPGTAETAGLLSKDRLALLPEGSYIVNVGRGSAIDEDALIEALNSGHLAGAALDVFRTEPIPKDSPLWTTRNLLITPHVAGNLTLTYTKNKNVEMFCEDLRNFAAGRPLKHLVDKRLGY